MGPYYNAYQQPVYQPYQSPYQDRLAQLQSQYQQTLPPGMQQAMQAPTQQPAQQQSGQNFLWVQGESGAKAWMVAPGTTVLLMDAEGSRFYLKSCDNAGMPSMRTFEFKEVLANAPQGSQMAQNDLDDKYVTREEYTALQRQYSEIIARLNAITGGNANE